MKNATKIMFLASLAIMFCFSFGNIAFAQTAPTIQTTAATSIQGTSATLNANVTNLGSYSSANIYFQWGTNTSYGSQTPTSAQGFTGSFSQALTGLTPSTTYYFRAVIQNSAGTSYGQDMTFTTGTTYNDASVQTVSATYVSNYQANLNGYLNVNSSNYANPNYLYFEWGTTTSYGSQSPQQTLNYSGTFFQQVANLNPNTTYHYRAIAKGNYGTIYGQDMTFTTTGSGSGVYGTGALTISKKILNLTSGNLNWQASVNAKPGDVLSFAITMQAGNKDVHNVTVTDILPANLIYKDNLLVNASLSYSGNPATGITIGTIPAGGVEIISFHAQVAPASNFSYGLNTITSNATVTSSETGAQTASAAILLNISSVSGATTLPTGITNNPVRDSFFLPMALIILMSWLYFTGRIYAFADWLGARM